MEMWSLVGTIIVALLSFAGTYVSNSKSNAIWQYRVQQLEEKQDKHNNVIERTYELEKTTVSMERDMKTAFNQIGEIKTSVAKVENNIEKLNEDVQSIREEEVRMETYIESKRKE